MGHDQREAKRSWKQRNKQEQAIHGYGSSKYSFTTDSPNAVRKSTRSPDARQFERNEPLLEWK